MAPIVIVHYGPAHYLRWTLRCARKTNPDARLVLLGDGTNCGFATGVAEYHPFERFASCDKVAEFDRVFRVVQGERHRFTKHQGVEIWLKFVFRRWFLIEEFLRREGIDAFWTFDSDTLIISPLARKEARFTDVAATTQCRGECLNGWVGSSGLVARYTSFILELFQDDVFLDAQRERLRLHAGLAFNEMDAFREFRQRHDVPTRHAAVGIDGEAFDDALAFVEGYEEAPALLLGKTAVKRLWTSGSGGVWARSGDEFVRLLTCNMSWMPDYLWRKILRCARMEEPIDPGSGKPFPGLSELDLREPCRDYFLREAAARWYGLRRRLVPSEK